MPIQLTCPACDRPLRVPDDLIGKDVKCPSCLNQFVATAAGITPSSAPPEETYRAAAEQPTLPQPGVEAATQRTDAFRATELQPTLPGRLPRLDDYEDDDDDDYPIRRRRRPDFESIRIRVSGPANGLMAVGIIGIVISALVGVLMVAQIGAMGAGGRDGSEMAQLFGIPMNLVVSIIILIGAQKMKKLESYGFAKAAAIIAMIPFVSPCCLLGLPFGIQSLNALNEPEVKAAFDARTMPTGE
jgi:hypothetical protein